MSAHDACESILMWIRRNKKKVNDVDTIDVNSLIDYVTELSYSGE